MRLKTAIARTGRAIAIAATMLSFAAQAQPQPQDLGPDADPPTRVARMSYASGRVSFAPGGTDEWVEARVNRPIVPGDRLWSDADSRAEVAIDDSTWALSLSEARVALSCCSWATRYSSGARSAARSSKTAS